MATLISTLKNFTHSIFTPTFSFTYTNFPHSSSMRFYVAWTNNPLDTNPTWTNISQDVREIHTYRGRNDQLDRMEAGECDIILNNESGNYYPDNTSGTYYPDVDVMKRILLQVYYGGLQSIWSGYIESYEPGFLGGGGYGSLMTLHCVGILGKVISLRVLNDATGYATEESGTRVTNVLTDCDVPSAWQNVGTGTDTLISTSALVNTNALDHLQKVQESELSILYEGGNGVLNYESRSHRTIAPHTVAIASWGDAPSDASYYDFSYIKDDNLLYNQARITRLGGTEQVSDRASSQEEYGIRPLVRSTLHSTDAQAKDLADYIVARHSITAGRVESVTFVPDDNSKWTECLTRNISDRIKFKNADMGLNKDYFIEAVRHDWDIVTANYQTTFQLSDAEQQFAPPDARNQTLYPNLQGDVSGQLLANPAVEHYQNIDEISSDGDATYLYQTSAYPSGYELFNITSASFSGDVNSVKVEMFSRTASGIGFAAVCIKTNSVEVFDSLASVGNVAYASYSKTWATNPITSASWTMAEIDALQVGVKLNETFGAGTTRCTQLNAIVNYTPDW